MGKSASKEKQNEMQVSPVTTRQQPLSVTHLNQPEEAQDETKSLPKRGTLTLDTSPDLSEEIQPFTDSHNTQRGIPTLTTDIGPDRKVPQLCTQFSTNDKTTTTLSEQPNDLEMSCNYASTSYEQSVDL